MENYFVKNLNCLESQKSLETKLPNLNVTIFNKKNVQ